jgi:hypothetical protein
MGSDPKRAWGKPVLLGTAAAVLGLAQFIPPVTAGAKHYVRAAVWGSVALLWLSTALNRYRAARAAKN